jgi:prepilin-type N-terminal cleavage/methylation domain-containing protein
MTPRRGFTLVEVLVVVAILMLLMGMLMPVLMIAQRAARKSATLATMHKVDTALRLFKTDMGTYPYQRDYADIDAGEAWTNRLYYHLGADIAVAALADVQADAADAAGKYAYDCTKPGGGVQENAPVSVHAFRKADIVPAWKWNTATLAWDTASDPWNNPNERLATATILNRMAQERARLAIFAGDVDVTGLRLQDIRRPDGSLYAAGRDNSAVRLLTAAARSDARPGWAADYLHGELEQRWRRGDAILDAYGKPLVYVCQITEGCRHVRSFLFSSGVINLDVRRYGLQRRGRRPLSSIDPFTGAPLSADPPALPDPGDLRRSDRRTYGAPGFDLDIELWSAGPDRGFGWMRNDLRNQDNIPLLPYDRGVP